MSFETQTGKIIENTWSYLTPYDVVDRAKIIAEEGERSTRVVEIDNYINYINNDLPAGYMVSTRMNIDPRDDDDMHYTEPYTFANKNDEPELFSELITFYMPNEEGEYVPGPRADISGSFLGDRVIIEDDLTIVVNTALGLGVIANKSIRCINTASENESQPVSAEVRFFKVRMGKIIYMLERDGLL